MFEISILCVMAIAAVYSATLWLMGRREDVLHGEFIYSEQSDAPDVVQPVSLKVAALPARDDLNALLTSIKRDLNDAAYG